MWSFAVTQPSAFAVPSRAVKRVFLHCTASDNGALQGPGLAGEVDRWHKQNGWQGIGYHFIIDKGGQIMDARPLGLTPAAQLGPAGDGNIATIAICTHGNWNFTAAGLQATYALCKAIDAAYKAAGRPVTFHGHREIDPKPCPVYDYRALLGLDAQGRFEASAAAAADVVAARVAPGGAPPAASAAKPILKFGSSGPEVSALQAKLGLPVTGTFDAATDAAVRAFQRAHALVDDGKVGANTRAALSTA